MEMASAHGLALKLVEMNRLDRINRNELCEIISEEDKIIKLWYIACQSSFSKKEFFVLMRKTILFVLSTNSLRELKKKELLKGISVYFNHFSNMLNSLDIRKPLIDIIVDPWKNTHFSWEELFQKKINIRDHNVQRYFYSEPEEIVLARVHFFARQNKDDISMIMAKNSFLFHSRISKSFKHLSKNSSPALHCNTSRKGIASMDWYLHNLRKKKSVNALYNELKQLTCHEGVLLIMRLRGLRLHPFAFSVVQIFVMQELIHPSKFCCTKKLFTLWSLLHKEKKTPMEIVNEEIRKMMAIYAPSSAHFYLLVDALWEQFGMGCVNIYVELYIRGLTSDLNLLEAAKHKDKHEDASYLESHISSIFYKLSTLFIDYHQRVARECMFSAFSLKPTKDRLYILQSMTHSILSDENEIKCDSSFNYSTASVQDCKCAIKCTSFCKSVKEHVLDHPILMKGIPNIPYPVVVDLVSVLESIRCFRFQYNVFDWHKNLTDLGDYLKDFTLCKSYESDTECEEDNVPVAEQKSESVKISTDSLQLSTKRKNNSCDLKETFPFHVGANIEVGNELLNKKIKLDGQKDNFSISTEGILDTQAMLSQKYGLNLGMEDAIENVIRATLDNNREKSGRSLDESHTAFSNTSFSPVNDGSDNLSSMYKPASENHIYPYSLTNYGKEKNLNPNFKRDERETHFNTEVEHNSKYNYFPPSTSVLSRALTSPAINHERVISPNLHLQMNSNTIQEQSSRQINQNNYLLKPVNEPYYSKSKDIQTNTVNYEKNRSVFQQEAHNLSSKNSLYRQNTVSQNSQYISNQPMQVVHRPNAASDFPKERFLPSMSVHSSDIATSPLNLTQAKQNTVQSSQALPVHHYPSKVSILKADLRYQATDNKTVNKITMKSYNESISFQDNQSIHCDRSSVIQHTMQHIKDNKNISLNKVEMPNQLAVSVNSDAAEKIRNVPKQAITNLPPIKVNVSNRSLPSSSLAVSANLVINRKPHPQIEIPSQTVSSNVSPVASDTITIPGILASPSVIVSSWETQRKAHGEMMYKKNPQVSVATTIDKRIYKNHRPYGRPMVAESKMLGQKLMYDKNNNSQVFKATNMPSCKTPNIHHLPSNNQSIASTSQNWMTVNKSSSQVVSQTTTSQPWYSEPYPKPHNSRNISPPSSGNNASTIQKNDNVTANISQKEKQEQKSYLMYSKQMHLKKQATVVPTIASLPHTSNNSASDSYMKSRVHYVTTFAVPNPSTSSITNTPVLVKGNIVSSSSSNNVVNIKTNYSDVYKTIKNNSITSTQVCDALQLSSELSNKNTVSYSASSILDNELQLSLPQSRTLQNSCCSPSEQNPCHNCSPSSENSVIQISNEKTLIEHHHYMVPSRKKMTLENDSVSTTYNSSFTSYKEDFKYEQSQISQFCPHCSNQFSEIELQDHILNCPSKVLTMKSSNLVKETDSSVMATENFCTKSLPEQNLPFQKETFLNNLPQTTKSFINTEDEIDVNAFSTCMDLINDKDLERIVQGIDSLDQIDNNYMPYIPPTDASDNYLSDNLCTDISEKPLQESIIYNKMDEINNYDINEHSSQLQEKKMSVFDFTESKSVQQPIFTKPQVSCAEKILANTSKLSNELSFSDIAEMIKGAMNENCHNEFDSGDMCLNNEPELNTDVNQSPLIDSALSVDQNSFLHAVENIVQQNIPKLTPPKLKFKCSYCSTTYLSRPSIKRHIDRDHPGLPIEYHKLLCESSNASTDLHDNKIKSKDVNSNCGNSHHDTNRLNYGLNSDIKQNYSKVDFENSSTLPKGRIKGFIKNAQTACKFCGKILTMLYMKKHITTQHKDMMLKIENSSDLNTEVNQSPPVDSINIPSVSPLLEQDFDSSTCLSASDALKKNSSFTVTETSHNSEDSGKLSEKTNVKFNFNVLEFPKEVESIPKITSEGNSSFQLENLEHENPIFEDSKIENPLFEEVKPENMLSFEEKNTCNVSDTELAEHSKSTYTCHICNKNKIYKSYGNLGRHLRNVHQIVLNKSAKDKQVNKIKNSKIQTNKLGSCTYAEKCTDTNNEIASVTAKEMPIFVSKKLAKIEKVPNCAASFTPQTKGHDNLPHLNTNKNLLRSVLENNLLKNCKLSQKSAKKKSSVQDKQVSIKDATKISEKDSRLPNKKVAATRKPLLKNLHSSDPELKSTDKTSALVPFESESDFQTAIKDQECSYPLRSNSEVKSELTASTILPYPSLNDISEIKENSDAKYPHVTDSQNLSIQSYGISPVSQIISNVSKCHFGGSSNNDSKKEVFEDNSLKLLIPENKNTNGVISNLKGTSDSSKVHFIQNEISKNKINNNQNNVDCELDLNCDKNDLGLCNQEVNQEFFPVKLNDSTFPSEVSNISTKKTEKITSVTFLSCAEDVLEKESDNVENILQENEVCKLKNISSNDKSIEKILHEIDSCESENIVSDSGSCNPENATSKINPCAIENTLPEKESSDHESILLENKSNESENMSLETESCIEGTLLDNKSNESENMLLENDCKLESTLRENKSREFEDILPENESSKLDLQENKPNEFETTLPENKPYTLENNIHKDKQYRLENSIHENERDIEKSIYENEPCELIRSFEENKSQKFTNSLQENKFHELENFSQANKTHYLESNSSKVDNVLLENISKLENKVYDLENKSKNKPCEPENVFQEKANTLQNIDSYQSTNQNKELCELKNTLPSSNMCRVCQQNLDSMEILSKHLNDFHNIPVLKKHFSPPSSPKKSTNSQDLKLSPPKLKLGTNESDSESMSDFDSPQNCFKATNDSSLINTSKRETPSSDVSVAVPSPVSKQIVQDDETDNLPATTMEKSFKQTEHSNKVSKSMMQSLSSLNQQEVITSFNKCRRHSFEDFCTISSVEHSDSNHEHLSFQLKNKFCKSDKRKSISLPNIKIIFPTTVSSQREYKVNNTKHLIIKNICVESSLSEDTSFSSVNENGKSSCDSFLSSSSSSSQNVTVPLNEIAINSNFILPDRDSPSVPRISSKKLILKSKFSGQKLIIQRLKPKKMKKKSKQKRFSRQKVHSKKIFKPIILTLKKATEVDKFLEINKQPIVKLIRLKENEHNCLSSTKTDSVSSFKCDKINMEAVVKLEKISTPKKRDEVVIDKILDKKQVVPNLLKLGGRESVQKRNKAAPRSRKQYSNLRNKTVSSKMSKTLNTSDESIEISDDSSDSVLFIRTVSKNEKLKNTSEFCPTPSTKKCSVVLNRLSI